MDERVSLKIGLATILPSEQFPTGGTIPEFGWYDEMECFSPEGYDLVKVK